MTKHCLALAAVAALAAGAAQAQAQTTLTAQGTPSFVTCNPFVGTQYLNGALLVSCGADKDTSGKIYSFTVLETDKPSPAEIVAFVQPYAMAVKILHSMPSVGVSTMTPFQSFNQRIGFYLANNKITGWRMMTAQ